MSLGALTPVVPTQRCDERVLRQKTCGFPEISCPASIRWLTYARGVRVVSVSHRAARRTATVLVIWTMVSKRNTEVRRFLDGAFGWGGTLVIRKRRCPEARFNMNRNHVWEEQAKDRVDDATVSISPNRESEA